MEDLFQVNKLFTPSERLKVSLINQNGRCVLQQKSLGVHPPDTSDRSANTARVAERTFEFYSS